jgi:hypothetical protein
VLRAKGLIERTALRSSGGSKRYILLDPRIHALLDGHTSFGAFPAVEAEKLVAQFSAGWLMRVSRKKTKQKPDIERLEGFDEVWALCLRKPRPGWRILGRFYEKDVFIGLRAWDKNVLFARYAQAAQEVIEDWIELFGARSPLKGDSVDDYLSPVCRDIDV